MLLDQVNTSVNSKVCDRWMDGKIDRLIYTPITDFLILYFHAATAKAFTASPLVSPLGPPLDFFFDCKGDESNLVTCLEPDTLQAHINDTGSDGGDDCFNEYLFIQCPCELCDCILLYLD